MSPSMGSRFFLSLVLLGTLGKLTYLPMASGQSGNLRKQKVKDMRSKSVKTRPGPKKEVKSKRKELEGHLNIQFPRSYFSEGRLIGF